jgi:hypothetical protein
VGGLTHFDCVLSDRFMAGDIIAKLPPSWKYFSMSLKHKKETTTVESLITSLDVEEKEKSKDVPRSVLQEGISNENVVEGKSGGGKIACSALRVRARVCLLCHSRMEI